MVPNFSKFALYLKSRIECVGIKHRQIGKGLIYLIIIIAPTFKTNSQSPLSNLFLKVTPKLSTHMKDVTFKQGEKVETKLDPTFRIIVKYPIGSIKSQWIYLNPLPRRSIDPYLLTI
jgi:hypothetical protein